MENRQEYVPSTGVMPADLLKSYRERLERDLGFVGKSRQMKGIRAMLSDYSASDKAITIAGPFGVGRRTLAKVIHLGSSDWWRPFIEADLTGIDDENSLKFLLGYREGHLFSASEFMPGLISQASRSTLCLRNFDRYPGEVQKRLCSVYMDRHFQPLSTKETRPLECRLIFTVQNTPTELKKRGHIEDGVYKMLSEKVITIPPLGKRRDDIIPLAEKFIRDCCGQFGLPLKRISKEAEKWLKKAPWNRNVNQLKKSVFSACFNTGDGLLHPSNFALAHDGNIEVYQQKQLEELSIQSLVEQKLESFLGRLGEFEATHLHEAIMDRVEEPLLRLVMSYAKGNQIRASRMLGINRNTLRAKLNKYNIKISREGKVE